MKKLLAALLFIVAAMSFTAFASENQFIINGECSIISNYYGGIGLLPTEDTEISIAEDVNSLITIYLEGQTVKIDGENSSIVSVNVIGTGTLRLENINIGGPNIASGIFAMGDGDLNIIIGDNVSIEGSCGIYAYPSNLALEGDNIEISGYNGIISEGHYYNEQPTGVNYAIDITGDNIKISGADSAINFDGADIIINNSSELYLEGKTAAIYRAECDFCSNDESQRNTVSIINSDVKIYGGIDIYNGVLEFDESRIYVESDRSDDTPTSAVSLVNSSYIQNGGNVTIKNVSDSTAFGLYIEADSDIIGSPSGLCKIGGEFETYADIAVLVWSPLSQSGLGIDEVIEISDGYTIENGGDIYCDPYMFYGFSYDNSTFSGSVKISGIVPEEIEIPEEIPDDDDAEEEPAVRKEGHSYSLKKTVRDKADNEKQAPTEEPVVYDKETVAHIKEKLWKVVAGIFGL